MKKAEVLKALKTARGTVTKYIDDRRLAYLIDDCYKEFGPLIEKRASGLREKHQNQPLPEGVTFDVIDDVLKRLVAVVRTIDFAKLETVENIQDKRNEALNIFEEIAEEPGENRDLLKFVDDTVLRVARAAAKRENGMREEGKKIDVERFAMAVLLSLSMNLIDNWIESIFVLRRHAKQVPRGTESVSALFKIIDSRETAVTSSKDTSLEFLIKYGLDSIGLKSDRTNIAAIVQTYLASVSDAKAQGSALSQKTLMNQTYPDENQAQVDVVCFCMLSFKDEDNEIITIFSVTIGGALMKESYLLMKDSILDQFTSGALQHWLGTSPLLNMDADDDMNIAG